jgi:hypothetical protein
MPGLVAALALALMSGQNPPEHRTIETLPRLAFEVLNQKRTERRILHLEDEIGPAARVHRGDPPPRAMLISAIGLDTPERAVAAIEPIDRELRPLGGRVLIIVQTGNKEAERAMAKKAWAASTFGFVIALDSYGLSKTLLGLLGPGYHLVVGSDGRIAGTFGPKEGLAQARAAFERILKEDEL